jgi:tetratricopeptide (TPR) repeat protein
VIAALDMALMQADPKRVLQASMNCLNKQASVEHASIASVTAMSSHARLGNFDEAQAHLMKARGFYADHLGLSDQQRARFLQGGHLIDDLMAVGNRDLEENPWLYFILGHAYGPSDAYGDTEATKRNSALRAWADFISNNRERMFGALGYLSFTDGKQNEAAKCLESVLLIVRRYDADTPARIESLWPRVILGDCYWASGQKQKAGECWRRVLSVESCVPESDLSDWDRFALPWIAKAKSSLAEHGIPVPTPEISRRASEHLRQAMAHLFEAEQFEASGVDLEELSEMIRKAGARYTVPLERATSELGLVERLDPFTWAKTPLRDSRHWWRYESAKGFLFQKIALVHLSNEKPALAAASYKQAMDIWPMLVPCALMGGMQAACGLFADARATYQMCIDRAEEFGSVEGLETCKEVLLGVQEALSELPR